MKKRLLQLLVFALVLALPLMALADFGDFSGDSDFGGSWDSGSSWDSDWDSDWDDDWSSSSWDDDDDSTPLYVGSFGGGSGDDDGFPIWIIVGIIIVIVIVVNSKKGSKAQAKRPVAPGAVPTAESKLKPMSEYMVFDAMFNETDFIEKLSNRYVQMQNCWQDKDISSLRPYFTDNLFNQMNRGVESMIERGVTNHVERIAVLGVTLRGFYRSEKEDHIIAEIRTRIVDYTLNDETGELVSGDRKKEKFMTYEWELTRMAGVLTGVNDGMQEVNCPNCGAPLSINTSAKCPYCDSVITVEENDWAIANIKGISQRTA